MTGRWLRDMLIASGTLSETGLSAKARLRRHLPCGGLTVAGIDDSGFDTWCEPSPLSRDGELHALLEGRRTWDLYGGHGLTLRRSLAIAHRPAGDQQRPVLAEHQCSTPLPAEWLAPPVAEPLKQEADF